VATLEQVAKSVDIHSHDPSKEGQAYFNEEKRKERNEYNQASTHAELNTQPWL
jgi:hypothetical protein